MKTAERAALPSYGPSHSTTTCESTGGVGKSAPLTPEETARALDIARELIKGGTPLFVAKPCSPDCGRKDHAPGKGDNGTGFHLPAKWQTSTPTLDVVNRWRPGDALCAVGGHVADFLDVDPRNGGDASEREVRAAGQWPRSFGRQTTPSGGTHDIISTTGERKTTDFMPGLDLQSGAADGTGRGFVFIAPTVKRSKVDGVARPYRWVEVPDVGALDEYRGADHSTEGIVARVHAKRASKRTGSTVPAASVDDDSPFATTADFRGGGSGVAADSPETIRRVMQLRDELASVADGQGWEAVSRLAYMAGQYVGAEQITAETATGIMLSALDDWTYRHPSDREQRAQDIRRQVAAGAGVPRTWEAPIRANVATVSTEDAVAALLSRMLDRDALDSIPAPTPLIRDVLDLESESWIIGAPGGFKSFVALDWACHVALGQVWRGKPVTQGRVVYVAAEGKKGIPLRVKAWEAMYEQRVENVLFLPEPVQVKGPHTDRTGEYSEKWAVLIEACRRVDPVLIVLDTQARITVGMNENDAEAMGVFIEAVRKLKEATGACVLVVHHTGRNGEDARGSSALDGAQDTEIRVDRPNGKARANLTAMVSMDKNKDGDESTRFEVQLAVVDLGTDPATGRPLSSLALTPWDPSFVAPTSEPEWRANLAGNQLDVMEAFREHTDEAGATRPDLTRWIKEHRALRDAPAMRDTSLTSALRDLKKKGLVLQQGARYVLAEYAEPEE